jgi:recombinational DNA repair protein RecT
METNLNQKNELMQLMKSASPMQLIQSDIVADRFKNLYQTIHGAKDGERFYEAEKFHFLKILQENPKLAACSKLSLYGCFMDVAVNGLSFDPSFKHLYIVPFNVNVGTKDQPKWESRASMLISGYGELVLRQKQGQIKYADNPVLVYDGDLFEFGTENEKTVLSHKAKFPRKSDDIIACYIKITRNDNSIDYKVLSIDEVLNFKKFSKDPKSKAWNEGLPGMVQSKTIKHAFKSYPKVRAGEFSQLASQTIDENAEVISNIPDEIDYGVNGQENNPGSNENNLNDDAFVSEGPSGNTVRIDEDDF